MLIGILQIEIIEVDAPIGLFFHKAEDDIQNHPDAFLVAGVDERRQSWLDVGERFPSG
jgi:hypothetical protein